MENKLYKKQQKGIIQNSMLRNESANSYPKSGCIDRDSLQLEIDRQCPQERNCKNGFL